MVCVKYIKSSQLRAQIPQLWNNVDSLPLHEIIPDIGKRSNFHLPFCVACQGSHMWEEYGVGKVEEPGIDFGLVRIHVQANGAQLPMSRRQYYHHN